MLIISPHWPTYEDLARLACLEPVFLATRVQDQFRIDADAVQAVLEQTGAKAVICSNPGNPTGKIYSGEELALLNAAAQKAGAIFIIDESFSSIVFDHDKWLNSTCSDSDAVFVINSFSKNFHLQGLRTGACLLPTNAVDAVMSAHQTVLSAAPTPSQQIALSIGDQANGNSHDYAEQWQLMLDFIARMKWDHLPTEGSFYLFPRIPDPANIRARLEHHGILSLPGDTFGEDYGDHMRICFGKPMSELRAMINLLEEVIVSRQDEAV